MIKFRIHRGFSLVLALLFVNHFSHAVICKKVPSRFEITATDYLRELDLPFFQNLLRGKVSSQDISAFVKENWERGFIHFEVPADWLTMDNLQVPDRPDPSLPLPDRFRRYGLGEDQSIFVYPITGRPGHPGAAYIYTSGEVAGPKQFDQFLGPPHVHHHASHLTIVTKGEGFFYMVYKVEGSPVLLQIPVKVGSAVVIPRNTVHTFWTGEKGTQFEVLSFHSTIVASDTKEFETVVNSGNLSRLPIMTHQEFLRRFGNSAP